MRVAPHRHKVQSKIRAEGVMLKRIDFERGVPFVIPALSIMTHLLIFQWHNALLHRILLVHSPLPSTFYWILPRGHFFFVSRRDIFFSFVFSQDHFFSIFLQKRHFFYQLFAVLTRVVPSVLPRSLWWQRHFMLCFFSASMHCDRQRRTNHYPSELNKAAEAKGVVRVVGVEAVVGMVKKLGAVVESTTVERENMLPT